MYIHHENRAEAAATQRRDAVATNVLFERTSVSLSSVRLKPCPFLRRFPDNTSCGGVCRLPSLTVQISPPLSTSLSLSLCLTPPTTALTPLRSPALLWGETPGPLTARARGSRGVRIYQSAPLYAQPPSISNAMGLMLHLCLILYETAAASTTHPHFVPP